MANSTKAPFKTIAIGFEQSGLSILFVERDMCDVLVHKIGPNKNVTK